MNVSLTPHLEKLVNQKVASGRYNSASEVVREGLRLIEKKDRLQEAELKYLQSEINLGLEDVAHGRVYEYDDEGLHQLIEGIIQNGKLPPDSK